MKYILISTLSASLFFCCNKMSVLKTSNRIATSIVSFASGTGDSAYYNLVTFYSDQTIFKHDSVFTTRLLATFKDSITNQIRGVNALYLNGTLMTRNSDSTYSNTLSDSSGNIYPATNINIKIRGTTSADTLTKSIYVPKKMISLISNYPYDTISSSKNFTLNWITDSHTPWDSVVIYVSYFAAESQYLDSLLPSSINPLFYTVPDNGSYTISSAALSNFPRNSMIQIQLGRGTQSSGTLPVSKRTIQFFGVSYATTVPLFVK